MTRPFPYDTARMMRLTAVAALTLITACPTTSAPPSESASVAVAEVRAAPASVAAVAGNELSWLQVPARTLIPPDAVAVLSPPLPARVTKIRVRPGEHVEIGAAVIELVMPDLIRAAGEMRAAQLRLNAYQSRLERLRPLLDQGLTRAAEVAELQAQIALVEAERESARAVLKTASVRDEQAQTLMQSGGALTLRAPIAGVVTEVSARVGEHREPNAGALVSIAQASAPQIEARFTWEPDASLTYAWLDGSRTVPLTLQGISPIASGQDGARVVWLLPPADVALPAGLLGRVQARVPEAWTAVPASALQETADGARVDVLIDGQRQSRSVTLRLRGEDEVLVEGIEPDMRVVESARHARP